MSGSLLSDMALKRVRLGSVLWHDWISSLSFFNVKGEVEDQAAYSNPDLPLADGMMSGIAHFLE